MKRDIPRIVRRLMKKHGTRNPFKLCEQLGIVIILKDLGKLKGLFKKILGKKVIFLNENLDEFSMYVVLAHELGHAVLHSSTDFQMLRSYSLLPRTSVWENEANKFAAELLIDENLDLNFFEAECFDIERKVIDDLFELKFNGRLRF